MTTLNPYRRRTTVQGLGTYYSQGTGGPSMIPSTADVIRRSQQKTYQPSPSLGSMAPMHSLSSTQPVSPMPLAGVAGGQRFMGVSDPKQAYRNWLAYGQATPPGPTPQDYQRYGLGETTDVAAQRYGQALELTPEAYQYLTPEYAAWRQVQSERGAAAEQAQRAQQALEGIQREPGAGTAGAPPDLAALLGEPGMAESYWINRQQKGEAERQAQFTQERALAEERRRRGGSDAVYQSELRELGRRETARSAQDRAAMERERAEMERMDKLNRATAHLQLYERAAPLALQRAGMAAGVLTQWPTQGEGWTNVEQYLRGTRNDELARQMGLSMWGQRGGGGGGSAMQSVPPYVTWGGRQRITSNRPLAPSKEQRIEDVLRRFAV